MPNFSGRVAAFPNVLTFSPGECKSSVIWLSEPIITPQGADKPYVRAVFSSKFVTFTPPYLQWENHAHDSNDWTYGKTVTACGNASAPHAHES